MKVNTNTNDWAAIIEWCQDQEAKSISFLRTPGHDAAAYDVHRGRLAALRDLLEAPKRAVQASRIPAHDDHGFNP